MNYPRGRFYGVYEVLVGDKVVGAVRRDPSRLHLSASKTSWQHRGPDGPWCGSFETRDQAAACLVNHGPMEKP